jgi:DNA mismatch repair protein MutL
MVGAPQGTLIAVSNLFYNVPARLKFLKSVTTEKRVIDEQVTRYALAYPKIRFRLTHGNRITFQSSGSGEFADVLTALYGPDTAKQLLPIEEKNREGQPEREADQIVVSGHVGPPTLNWANRNHITLFVNGRWFKDNRLSYAVIQAYHTLLPTGRYPLAIIFLNLPAESIDVNVHPAKTEVRFRQANTVFGAIQRAVRQTLIADSPIPHAGHFASFQSPGWGGSFDQQAFTRHESTSSQEQLELDWSPGRTERPSEASEGILSGSLNLAGDRLPIMRVVGQVGASYIITEGPDGLYLIDQHAAHERILYEDFMAAWERQDDGTLISQGIVTASAVHLSPSQATLLRDHLDLLARMGFQVEPFGPNTFMVRGVPAILTKLDPARALMDVVEDLERGETPMQRSIESRIILRVCKSAAVKAGQTLGAQEMEAMVRQLERSKNPHTCPHGRPTMIHLSVGQLAREFGRT